MNSSSAPFDRYLRLLGVDPGSPDRALLSTIVRAHLMTVPFENISKLYSVRCLGLREMPSLDRFLDGIENFGFGGTCYTNNHHLFTLLRQLGFHASFCGADMRSGPDIHTVILVRVDGREYLVDVGYGAPFDEPLPVDLETDAVIELGRDRFVLHPRDERGRSRMDHIRDDEMIHGYVANPTPRDLDHFAAVIRDSYTDEATFMNALVVVRFFGGRSVAVFNDTLVENRARGCTVTPLPDAASRVDAIVRHFGIPREIVLQATADLGELRGIHGGP